MARPGPLIFSFFCVAALIKVNGDFNPDVNKFEGLLCYQCESNSSAALSLCDSDSFKAHKAQERLNLVFQCPEDLWEYCVKKTVFTEGALTTMRGCSNGYDSNNVALRSGCADIIENNNLVMEICLCMGNLCNASAGLLSCAFNCFLLSYVLSTR